MAAAHGIVLHELSLQQASLEDAFMELTREDVEFKTREIGIGAVADEVAA